MFADFTLRPLILKTKYSFEPAYIKRMIPCLSPSVPSAFPYTGRLLAQFN